MVTDSKILFEVFSSAKCNTEKRLMVDIASESMSYLDWMISEGRLIILEHNPAGGLTKVHSDETPGNKQSIQNISYKVERYVTRSPASVQSSYRTYWRGSASWNRWGPTQIAEHSCLRVTKSMISDQLHMSDPTAEGGKSVVRTTTATQQSFECLPLVVNVSSVKMGLLFRLIYLRLT